MRTSSYTTSFTVASTPAEAFAAIIDPRAWWASKVAGVDGSRHGRIEGPTDRVGGEFVFEVPGVHYSRIRVTELVPGVRVVWRVVDATIHFVADTDEWTGTEIRFEVSETDDGTRVCFTHDGLEPGVECYEACSTAWNHYVGDSLRTHITSRTADFTTSIVVDADPQAAFEAINRPEIWWNQLIEGSAATVGSEFGFAMPGVHTTTMRVTELDPGRKVVWHVLENHFAFVENQDEWLGTDVVFDIRPGRDDTTVTVTHVGLVPTFECYEVCSGAWTHHLDAGLRAMLVTGDPQPITAARAAEVAREFARRPGHGNVRARR